MAGCYVYYLENRLCVIIGHDRLRLRIKSNLERLHVNMCHDWSVCLYLNLMGILTISFNQWLRITFRYGMMPFKMADENLRNLASSQVLKFGETAVELWHGRVLTSQTEQWRVNDYSCYLQFQYYAESQISNDFTYTLLMSRWVSLLILKLNGHSDWRGSLCVIIRWPV